MELSKEMKRSLRALRRWRWLETLCRRRMKHHAESIYRMQQKELYLKQMRDLVQ